MAVTQPLQREEEIPGKYIAGIENMKTMPLDRSGMAEPISYTAPVQRNEEPVSPKPMVTAPVIPAEPKYVPEPMPAQYYSAPERAPEKKRNSMPAMFGIAAIVLVLVIGFFTVHVWKDATCTEPRTCLLCGKTEGKSLGHDWIKATCTDPKTCRVCGKTGDMALGHTWRNATCTNPKTCSVCNVKEGQPLGHDWKAATYDAPKTCTRCSKTEGEPLGFREEVPGSFEKFHKNNSNTYALIFDTPLKNCSGLTLNFEPEFKSNTYVGEWKFYYRDGNGRWNYYANFTLSGTSANVKYTFNPKLNITGVAVIPAKNGSYSYSFYLWVTNAYAGK